MKKQDQRREALVYHAKPSPGKIEVVPKKPYRSQRDLALAYSPGVALPCLEIDFLECGAEAIPLPNDSIDTVVITYTLCTIPDTQLSNEEIMRVLKPNGKLLFCEHGLAPDINVAKWQKRINPIWNKIAGGCNLNRDIPKLIKSSGLKIINMEDTFLPYL